MHTDTGFTPPDEHNIAPLLAAFGYDDVGTLAAAGPCERAALGVYIRGGDLTAALTAACNVRQLMARGGVFYAMGRP